ncbi:MAG TPA: Calx-beta domain-containing protein [Acidimicrobiales bacterium]|nr:Calx-beta domain-containing protein [Acidimicrobiales bacterium]
MFRTKGRTRRRKLVTTVVGSAMVAGTMLGVAESPAAAAVSAVKGSACAYTTNVGLFGGPQYKLGCAPQFGSGFVPANESTLAPSVALPADGSGSATAITASDPDGAKARYGPAVIHGGIWPPEVSSPTPSGPQYVSTQGTPESGTVTSSADITLNALPYPLVPCATGPCGDPGGFGPAPVWGDSLHAECTATESSVTGSTTFSNAFVAKGSIVGGEDDGAPDPNSTEAIPDHPPVNYTRSGVISNVGDVFTVVFNQQIVNPDGSLTVNAVHMYLFGPVAVGEVIRGQATCGTTPSAATPTDTVSPTCGLAVIAHMGPSDPRPLEPYTELIGTFDAGGIQSVDVHVEHGTVSVGQPSSPQAYLHFTPGQTTPLSITAVRDPESESAGLPMIWSFDVTDVAGNTSHCSGSIPPRPPGSPLAYNDYYSTVFETPLTVAAPGVLANDTDPENDTLSATLITQPDVCGPCSGTLAFSADGSLTYTPDAGFSGEDSFRYSISDGNGGTDEGRVSIHVTIKPPNVFVGNVSVTEGNAGQRLAYFTVGLSTYFESDVTVNYTTADGTATTGTDYTATSGSVTIFAGENSATVQVPVLGDTADEGNETFTLELSSPTFGVITHGTGTATIVDDDPATAAGRRLAIGDVTVYESDTGVQFATFTVSLDKASNSTVKVNYSGSAVTTTKWEDHFPLSPGTLTFAPGTTSKKIKIWVLSDTNPEPTETFKIKLSSPYGASILDGVGIGTVLDEDGV